MAPQSRGPSSPFGLSKSTPNLPNLSSFHPTTPPAETTPTAPPSTNQSRYAPTSTPNDNDHNDDADASFQSHYSLTSPSPSSSSSSSSTSPTPSPTHLPPRPPLRHSTSAFLSAHAFAPPFYNRPPTPLPPSPSLTSLLRPSFSTTTSRPTTPDSSENDTEAAVAKSARTAMTVPRASPKVPTYEYYGFVLYLGSSLAFLIYLLWSYLPSPFLHQLGIYYYPNRWWSLAIPSFLVMCIIYIYVALALYNVEYLTLPMSSVENIVDEAAQVAVVDAKGRIRRKGRGGRERGEEMMGRLEWRALWSEGTDAVMDVPVGGVCEILYGAGMEGESG